MESIEELEVGVVLYGIAGAAKTYDAGGKIEAVFTVILVFGGIEIDLDALLVFSDFEACSEDNLIGADFGQGDISIILITLADTLLGSVALREL